MDLAQVNPYLRAGRLARRRGGGWVKVDQFGNYISAESNMRLTLSDEDRFADDWEIQYSQNRHPRWGDFLGWNI
jgi:hypothetical protein